QRLSYEYGVWENVSNYYQALRTLEFKIFEIMPSDENSSKLRNIKDNLSSLYLTHDEAEIKQTIESVEFDIFKDNNIKKTAETDFFNLKNNFEHLIFNKQIINRYLPTIYWYGFDNQYHNWISNFIVGEFGKSYIDKRPVSSKIFDALKWSMILSILSIIIAYIVAVPLGVKSAVDKGKTSEKIITTGLFLLYSLPNFWIATMLIQWLGDGDGLGWFPTHGLGELPESAPYWDRFFETAYHFILPLFCLTYASFAFISRQMRGGMLNVLEMDYIRTARAKGLKKQVVIWKHAFRNSLIPIITLFANIFPAAISGSFIIEVIFSIPGMGQLTLQAIFQRDYPIVFTVLMFSSILTLVGILIADIMYAFVDPRISFSNKKS
ncbi:MAG: ABC transporter permease, partial [Flavobacteriales bacterium]|nr:ABC transporter permease [Flavobacteriales bacterium]